MAELGVELGAVELDGAAVSSAVAPGATESAKMPITSSATVKETIRDLLAGNGLTPNTAFRLLES